MRNLKVWLFVLLFWVIVVAWCENIKTQEKLSCDGEEICPVEVDAGNHWIEIEESPSVVIGLDEEETADELSDEPMMRKMVVDENATAEEIEQDMVNTCANAGWTWADWACILEDGSTIAF